MLRRLAPLALAATLAIAGCDSGSDAIGLTGRWEGTITSSQNATVSSPVELQLNDTGQSITGTGEIDLADGTILFGVTSGTFINTSVNLALQFSETPFSGSLTGTLVQTDPGRIEGTFSGPRMANGPVRIEIVAR